MAYWSRGAEGAITSWGSTNIYSTILAGITPVSAVLYVGSDDIDVTGLGAFAVTKIPGLKSARVDFRGYAGSTTYIGNNGNLAYSAGGYALHVPEWNWSMATPTVHDITEFNPTVVWRSFMPDIYASSIRFTAGIDSTTALVMPPDPAAALPTLTLTYKSGATIASTGLIRAVSPSVVRGQKNVATYELVGTGNTTTVGGIFGSRTWGGSNNSDTTNGMPLWSAGGSAAGAMVITAVTGRTYSLADSFITSMRLSCNVGGAVMLEGSIQATGAVTVA